MLGSIRNILGTKFRILTSKNKQTSNPQFGASQSVPTGKHLLSPEQINAGRAIGQAANVDKNLINEWKAHLKTQNQKPTERILGIAKYDLQNALQAKYQGQGVSHDMPFPSASLSSNANPDMHIMSRIKKNRLEAQEWFSFAFGSTKLRVIMNYTNIHSKPTFA